MTLSPYVDDILLAGTRLQEVKTIKDWLSLNFLMKYMGEAEYLECQDKNDLFKKDVIIVPKDIYSEDPGTVQYERL